MRVAQLKFFFNEEVEQTDMMLEMGLKFLKKAVSSSKDEEVHIVIY